MANDVALLFLTPHIPSLPSVSVTLPSGRTVIQPLGDEELRTCHEELASETRDLLRRSLVLLKSSHLRFVGPPVVERKREVEAELRAQAGKYLRLQDLVIAKWDVIASQMDGFYAEYESHIRHRRATELDPEQVRARFSLSWTWLPFQLPQELQDQMFSPEEQAQIRREIEEAARDSVGRKVEGYLREMVGCLETMAGALRDQRVASRKTIARMTEAYKEVAAIVPHTAASEEHAERVVQFGRLLAEMEAARDACDDRKGRPAALGALAVAVEAARREAEPMLDAWAFELPGADADEPATTVAGSVDIGAFLGVEADLFAELATV